MTTPEQRAKSRRYKVIKLFCALTIVCIIYVGIMIPILKEKFTPFITFFLTTAGALIAAIGTWIGFVSAKQKDA
jgi:hypothetical protein